MFLLDTDTLIDFLKNNDSVVDNFKFHADAPKAFSVISYGELVFGAEKSSKSNENLAKVYRIAEIFPIIEISRAVMDTFGRLKSGLEKNGISVDDFDLIIASTALSMGYSVVTSNTKHFCKVPGLDVVSWRKKI